MTPDPRDELFAEWIRDPRVAEIVRNLPPLPPPPAPADEFVRGYGETLELLEAAAADGRLDRALAETDVSGGLPALLARLRAGQPGAGPTPFPEAPRLRGGRGVPAPEANARVARFLAERHADGDGITIRVVADATGVSVGGVVKTTSWRDFQAQREERARARATGNRRHRSLTPEMLAALPDGWTSDPAVLAAAMETARTPQVRELFALALEQFADDRS